MQQKTQKRPSTRRAFPAPPPMFTMLESRAFMERMHYAALRPMFEDLLRWNRRGDGHGVLVLPGFMSGDESTLALRRLLRRLDYRAFGWGLGRNLGPTRAVAGGLSPLVHRVADQTGGQPISIVGWSLGGVYARRLARTHPDMVRQVITLGSPIQMSPNDRSSLHGVWKSLKDRHDPSFAELVPDVDQPPLTMPSTSVYTTTDGIVSWRASLLERDERSENIQVYGSHIGLGHNPAALYAVADRLAQPADSWKHFRPPSCAIGAYPRPANYRPPRTATAA